MTAPEGRHGVSVAPSPSDGPGPGRCTRALERPSRCHAYTLQRLSLGSPRIRKFSLSLNLSSPFDPEMRATPGSLPMGLPRLCLPLRLLGCPLPPGTCVHVFH